MDVISVRGEPWYFPCICCESVCTCLHIVTGTTRPIDWQQGPTTKATNRTLWVVSFLTLFTMMVVSGGAAAVTPIISPSLCNSDYNLTRMASRFPNKNYHSEIVEQCMPVRDKTTDNNTIFLGFLHNRALLPGFHPGAIVTAVENINDMLKDNNRTERVGFCWADTDGNSVRTVQIMVYFWQRGVYAFIGPSGRSCLAEAIVATAWNIPLISYFCQDNLQRHDLGRHSKHTFIRTFPPKMKIAKYIMSIMRHFGWNRTVILHSGEEEGQFTLNEDGEKTKGSIWKETVEALMMSGLEIVDTSILPRFYFPQRDLEHLRKIFQRTKTKTRIYIFLGNYDAMIDFVRYKHTVLSEEEHEGDYVVLAVTHKLQAPLVEEEDKMFLKFEENHPEKKYNGSNVIVKSLHRKPFRNVLLLSYTSPANVEAYNAFMRDAALKSIKHFDMYNFTQHRFQKYNFSHKLTPAAYLYDAVMLYGRTLIDVLNNSPEQINNGQNMTDRMKNRPYLSIQGYSVTIDSNGDSMDNYSIYSVTNIEGTPESDGYKMTKIGQFHPVLRHNKNNTITLNLTVPEDTLWISGRPKAIPECGWDWSLCDKVVWVKPTLIGIGVVTLVVVLATFFLCRHYRNKLRIASLLWKIEYKELLFTDGDDSDPMMSDKPKRKMQIQASLYGVELDPKKQARSVPKEQKIRIAALRGSLVAVRFIAQCHVELTQDLCKQLHFLKTMQHDNINRFIGACLELPSICLITQYCSRGSLRDLLENDDMHFHDMFIASLVFDLIRGMLFLHDSEIHSHGNLKSTNCLVDSRFVLQIADFGIPQLRDSEPLYLGRQENYYNRLLWRAPELLRLPDPVPGGTQHGDVYSFGIILFEIHCREGPWGPTIYSAKEIIEELKFPSESGILRPDTSILKCDEFIIKCMKATWNEIPEARPDFKTIRLKLKPLQRGLKSNIFDNMMAIMEKYAENLEGIVAARTELLVLEKQKTEALLHRMLPKYVAEQLKIGNPVVPEQYNSVTIYFSDIVGFTAISAESSPLEVVNLLNDMYTCFDSIIGEYDVYKVETIGDAYMVVSGLPVRNADNHAGEIASMSLHLLKEIGKFRMRHRPDETLSLRIGIHSGSVVSGVVGLKMPRYCLFGDTVNTASRMESNGEPMKIHCSTPCRILLVKLGGYILEERGYVSMKGKGKMFTYFLTGEDKSHRLRRISIEKCPQRISDVSLNVKNICLNATSGQSPHISSCSIRSDDASIRSDDSALVGTESQHLLLNGKPHDFTCQNCELSSNSLESQV